MFQQPNKSVASLITKSLGRMITVAVPAVILISTCGFLELVHKNTMVLSYAIMLGLVLWARVPSQVKESVAYITTKPRKYSIVAVRPVKMIKLEDTEQKDADYTLINKLDSIRPSNHTPILPR